MDTGRIRRELVAAVRLPATEERWIVAGTLVALVAWGLWVAATGAALNYTAAFAGIPITVEPWTTTTTVALAVTAVLWVLAPAAVVAYYLTRYLTNPHDNIAQHYRLQHPLLLVLPPLVLFAAVAGAGIAREAISGPVASVLLLLGILVLVRTVAYSYRVFSFSVPWLTQAFVFLTAVVVGITLLVSGAVLAGRQAFVEHAASGVGDLLGVDGVVALTMGSTTVGGVTVPTLPGIAAGLPVALSVLYLAVQILAGLIARLRKPDVPRSDLRTGQRYPSFAHPRSDSQDGSGGDEASLEQEHDQAASSASGADSGTQESGPAGTSDGTTAGADVAEAPGHTKVFTPPDAEGTPNDSASGGAIDADDSGDNGRETAVVADASGYACPSCGDEFPADVDFAFCPACGTELEPAEK
jgi:hypothetical protein